MKKLDERRIYYTYDISRPDTGESCYIGKGKGNRWKTFTEAAKYNPYLRNTIIKYKQNGMKMLVTIVRNKLTEAEAFETEIALIASIGRKDKNKGPLLNMTNGGEGMSGWRPSQHYIDIMANRFLTWCANQTEEQKLETSRKGAYGRVKNTTAEERIEMARKAGLASAAARGLADMQERGRKLMNSLTPDQQKERGQKARKTVIENYTQGEITSWGIKGWETRRARAAIKKNFEESQ
jgi:hypothetical protein